MKSGLNFRIWIISFFSIALFLSNCKDPCLDKNCYNGFCIDGDCFCEDGYYGDNCEFKESDKFAGTYFGTYRIDDLDPFGVKVKINNKYENPRDIDIEIDDYSPAKKYLSGRVKGDSIFTFNQFVFEPVGIDGDSTLILFYPGKGIFVNDSILKFDFKEQAPGNDKASYKFDLKKN